MSFFRHSFCKIVGPLAVAAVFVAADVAHSQVGDDIDLLEMVQSSGMIFSGVVTHVEGGVDESGDIVTWTTFRVDRPIRGLQTGSHRIKQYGGTSEQGSMHVAHMRYFVEGERVLVLLYPPSDRGFTSPIGMDKGAFRIENGNVLGVTSTMLEGLGYLMERLDITVESDRTMRLDSMAKLIQELTTIGSK